MGTNKYGESTRRKGGKTFVTHAPFPRPFARKVEEVRKELAEQTSKPGPIEQRDAPKRMHDPRHESYKRNQRSVAQHLFKGMGILPKP
jgi:hypothetical protein